MYKKGIYTVTANEPLTPSVWRMTLEGDTQYLTRPGQFVNIEVEGLYLRRPISVCDYNERTLTLIYKVVGEAECRRPLLVGGGVGVPPLYNLAKKLIDKGRKVTVVLGFNTASEVFYEEEFRALGAEVFVTTADGTHGIKGFVTTAIAEKKPDFDYFYACGPLPMLRALSDATGDIPGELSFEERMGCGFGGCMGCSCQTKNGAKRICKEGPVLKKEEIIW
ncbi:MAG: dihydroorotate dehydrogenase electron transfer subunit [Alistipes putredinis]|nr:dihydroorotate dehydrogenase electron transfer subunit [Alistipes putredinis]